MKTKKLMKTKKASVEVCILESGKRKEIVNDVDSCRSSFLNLAQGLKFLFSFLYQPMFCHSLMLLWERDCAEYLYFVSTVPNNINWLRII